MEKTKNQLAIKGHPTRGKEVIEILEMLGANNKEHYTGSDPDALYILNDCDNSINLGYGYDNPAVFKLEEFLRKYPFRIGDTVVIKSADCSGIVTRMRWRRITSICSEICEIRYGITPINLNDKNKSDIYWHSSNDIEFSNASCKNDIDPLHELCESKTSTLIIDSELCKDEVEIVLGDYEIVTRDGKIYVVKKKPKYPTTYEECCKIMGIDSGNFIAIRNLYCDDGEEIITDHEDTLKDKFDALWELLICRDAYWKIAGEQMGLEKPWEPDWDNLSTNHEYIKISKGCFTYSSRVLVFPTAEMRDFFYNNFKDLIEKCKELL